MDYWRETKYLKFLEYNLHDDFVEVKILKPYFEVSTQKFWKVKFRIYTLFS
jgi:hypothetical protein